MKTISEYIRTLTESENEDWMQELADYIGCDVSDIGETDNSYPFDCKTFYFKHTEYVVFDDMEELNNAIYELAKRIVTDKHNSPLYGCNPDAEDYNQMLSSEFVENFAQSVIDDPYFDEESYGGFTAEELKERIVENLYEYAMNFMFADDDKFIDWLCDENALDVEKAAKWCVKHADYYVFQCCGGGDVKELSDGKYVCKGDFRF